MLNGLSAIAPCCYKWSCPPPPLECKRQHKNTEVRNQVSFALNPPPTWYFYIFKMYEWMNGVFVCPTIIYISENICSFKYDIWVLSHDHTHGLWVNPRSWSPEDDVYWHWSTPILYLLHFSVLSEICIHLLDGLKENVNVPLTFHLETPSRVQYSILANSLWPKYLQKVSWSLRARQ